MCVCIYIYIYIYTHTHTDMGIFYMFISKNATWWNCQNSCGSGLYYFENKIWNFKEFFISCACN